MHKNDILLLLTCAAFALGEGLGSVFSAAAEAWYVPLAMGVLVFLLGYGFSVRGWHFLVLVLVGLSLVLRATVAEELSYRSTPWLRNARRHVQCSAPNPFRREFSRRLGLGLGSAREAASLNRAILLGERASLDASTRRAFVDSGTVHVFAISGLHVMVVVRVLMILAAILFVPARWQGLVALPVAWGYVLIIGAPPSAVRAVVMASFYLLAPAFGRRSDALRAWVLAFFVLHTINPRQICAVGSQLSFLVMLALIVVGRELYTLKEGHLKTAALSFSAWVVGVPIAAHVFGTLAPGGLLANLVLIGAAGYSVIAGVIGLLVSFISECAAAHFNNLAALFTEAMAGISWGVSHLPFSHFNVPRWDPLIMAEWYVAWILVLVLYRLVRRRRNML